MIDGRNQYAIPGLTDTHVHLGRITDYQGHNNLEYSLVLTPRVTAKLLAHGITTVRDAGGITVGLKQAIDEGLVDLNQEFIPVMHISVRPAGMETMMRGKETGIFSTEYLPQECWQTVCQRF